MSRVAVDDIGKILSGIVRMHRLQCLGTWRRRRYGHNEFNLPVASAPLLLTNRQITATATDSLGNASAFSTCAPYFDRIFAGDFEP